jgi:hypothetical protein
MKEKTTPKLKTWHKVFFVILAVSCMGAKLWQFRWPEATIELGDRVLHVQVAETLYQTHKGLGDRDTLAPYDGMLFLFDFPKKPGIVMRDMRFPIDIVWLYDGTVVDIAPNVPIEPGVSEFELTRYYPREEATMVLELPAGWSGQHNLEIGDTLRFVEEE